MLPRLGRYVVGVLQEPAHREAANLAEVVASLVSQPPQRLEVEWVKLEGDVTWFRHVQMVLQDTYQSQWVVRVFMYLPPRWYGTVAKGTSTVVR